MFSEVFTFDYSLLTVKYWNDKLLSKEIYKIAINNEETHFMACMLYANSISKYLVSHSKATKFGHMNLLQSEWHGLKYQVMQQPQLIYHGACYA